VLQSRKSRVPVPMGSSPDGFLGLFFIDLILETAIAPGVYSASNRNKYHEILLVSRARPACKAGKFSPTMN
jgi:hypothetical protein